MLDIVFATHNTMTYLPIKQWYFKPFAFIARCQDIDIYSQMALGTRVFDIRVGKYKGKFVFKHGFCAFSYKNKDALTYLCDIFTYIKNCYDNNENFFFSITLETRKRNKKLEKEFISFVDDIFNLLYNVNKHITSSSNIIICGGQNKADWFSLVPRITDIVPHFKQAFASSPTNKNKLDRLYPKRYAINNNAKLYDTFDPKEYDCLMLDFVELC